PDALVLCGGLFGAKGQDEEVEDKPPLEPRDLDDAPVAEELPQVRPERLGGRGVRGAELDEQDAGGRHGGGGARGGGRGARQEGSFARPSPLTPRPSCHYFFLHSGPSLASCFSVMWPSPLPFRAAERSAFIGVNWVHWGGTLASAKI